jgi:hypothetical protein
MNPDFRHDPEPMNLLYIFKILFREGNFNFILPVHMLSSVSYPPYISVHISSSLLSARMSDPFQPTLAPIRRLLHLTTSPLFVETMSSPHILLRTQHLGTPQAPHNTLPLTQKQ